MLFWLFVIVTIVGMLLIALCERYVLDFDNEWMEAIGIPMAIMGWLAVLVSIVEIMFANIGIDARIERYNARYESLVYQYENDIYDNDNDLGKKELMDDIQEWNEDLSYRKEIQDDFWLGIYYPNIYDQFEKIELK